MKTIHRHIITLVVAVLLNTTAFSQRICHETKKSFTLKNNTTVDVYKERGSNTFYYAPTTLKLSLRNNTPEYSFQEFKKNENASPDGAIFHCLVTWGITKSQTSELRQCIANKYGTEAILAGAIQLDAVSQDILFSNTPIGTILQKSITSKGSLPTFSNSKMALSFRIKKEHVATLKNALKTPLKLKHTSITLQYKFNTYKCNSAISSAVKNTIKVVGKLQNWFQ